MKSVMTHQFSRVPSVAIPRSAFDRSHGWKGTFDSDYLIPVYVDEMLPGDTFKMRMAGFARLNTPTFPIMDNMRMETFFFKVPIRQVWTNFIKAMGEQEDPGDSIDYPVPTCTTSSGYAVGSLQDYMGIPPGIASLEHSNLFLRAYNHIWNNWFRHQELQDSVVVDKDDGPDTEGDYVLLRANKKHDYFTSALTSPQRGDAIDLPLGTSAPVVSDGTGTPTFTTASNTAGPLGIEGVGTTNTFELNGNLTGFGGNEDLTWVDPELKVDLTGATAATINSLRQSFQIQRLLEKDARGGTRYPEILQTHFGVTDPQMLVLQRPEYIGGGVSPINITPVAITGNSNPSVTGVAPGDLAALGTSAFGGHGFTTNATEHCLVIGLAVVRADLTYQQGLNRMWSRSTRYDFYWPSLSQIGEQSILNKEIWADGSANDDLVFGYVPRYDEYRYKPSMITGLFRSDAAGTLDAWHLSQDFASLPSLNSTFIESNTPIDRVINVPSEPHFIMDAYFSLRCVRPMPLYGVPGMIDHF